MSAEPSGKEALEAFITLKRLYARVEADEQTNDYNWDLLEEYIRSRQKGIYKTNGRRNRIQSGRP